MVIHFPTSQIYTGSNCSISVAGLSLPCSVINSTAVLTSNVAGQGEYLVEGLFNQLSYSVSGENDLVQVSIGRPYTRAATLLSTSSSVSPKLTLGTISMHNVSSSSLTLLSRTMVSYNFSIENTLNIDGFITDYAPFFYYLPFTASTSSPAIPVAATTNPLICTLNQVTVNCTAISSNSIFIGLPAAFNSYSVLLTIDGLVNYVSPANWTIQSVQALTTQPGNYSDVDVYASQLSGLTAMSPSQIKTRVIFPDNYVQSGPVDVVVLIDSSFADVPTASLNLNLSIPQGNCQLLALTFRDSFTLSCTFNS